MTHKDQSVAKQLVEDFSKFWLIVYNSTDDGHIIIDVEEIENKTSSEYVISVRLDHWENKCVEVKIDEDHFRYFATLLFCREKKEDNIQFWRKEEVDWPTLKKKYTKEQIEYLDKRGSMFFSLSASFKSQDRISYTGVKTRKVQSFITYIFFKMKELNRSIFDNLSDFSHYVVPLGLVEVYDDEDVDL